MLYEGQLLEAKQNTTQVSPLLVNFKMKTGL